jgi:hypothetical protein
LTISSYPSERWIGYFNGEVLVTANDISDHLPIYCRLRDALAQEESQARRGWRRKHIRGEHKALIETFNRYLPLSVEMPLGDGSLDNEVETFHELLTSSGEEVGLRGVAGKAEPFHWTMCTKALIRNKKVTEDAHLKAAARGDENVAVLLREAVDAALKADLARRTERLSSRLRKTKDIGHALSRGDFLKD